MSFVRNGQRAVDANMLQAVFFRSDAQVRLQDWDTVCERGLSPRIQDHQRSHPMTPSLAAPSPEGTLQSLTALIERVEGMTGDDPVRESVWPLIVSAFPDAAEDDPDSMMLRSHLWAALCGNLNEAVAFTEKLFPVGWWCIEGERGAGRALVSPVTDDGGDPASAEASHPALALVLADLRAHAAKEMT